MNESAHRPAVVFFPFPFLSHYVRCIVLARILKSQYRIVFAAHPCYNQFVLDEGFELVDCETFDQSAVQEQIIRFDFSWLNSPLLEVIVEDQCQTIRLLRPVLVFSDNMPTVKMAAEITGIPHVSVLNTYMTRYYSGIRGVFRSHYSFPIVSRLPKYLQRVLIEWGESVSFKLIHRRFRLLRTSYGLNQTRNYLAELEGDLNFCVDLPEMFGSRTDMPQKFKVIGPLIFDGPAKGADLSRELDGNKKTLFVNMGSTGSWSSVRFLAAPEFLRYNIVIAGDNQGLLRHVTGWHFPFIAASDVLPFADLVICHGGNGTLYQAFQFGKPVLCSAANFEQQWNIDSVTKLGLGLEFNEGMRPDELLTKIEDSIKIGSSSAIARMSALLGVQQTGLETAVREQISRLISEHSQPQKKVAGILPLLETTA